nr:hypothetical protein [Tanacetum cinerariifolium]
MDTISISISTISIAATTIATTISTTTIISITCSNQRKVEEEKRLFARATSMVLNTAYKETRRRRIGKWEYAFSCEVQALIRPFSWNDRFIPVKALDATVAIDSFVGVLLKEFVTDQSVLRARSIFTMLNSFAVVAFSWNDRFISVKAVDAIVAINSFVGVLLKEFVTDQSVLSQEIDKSIKDHDKAIADIQATLEALMKQHEQSIKQQEQLLQHVSDGSLIGSSFNNDPKTNRPMRNDETPNNMKLRYAIIHLEGDAIQWHQAFMKTRGATVAELTRENYVRVISGPFSNAMFEDPMEEIASLIQDDDLHEYNNAFDALLHKAYGLAKIQNINNTTLENKVSSAKGGATHPKNTNETGRVTAHVNASKLPLLPTPNTRPIGETTTKTRAKVSRWLTSKELELKHMKGECFWCTKKFVPGHKCPRNQFFIIEVEDEDKVYEENKEDEDEKLPQILIHALTGLLSYSTMRIRGAMGNRQLHILVDSGSTHNFINVKLARKLQCSVKDIPSLNVSVAGEKQLQCNKMCPDF